MAKKKPVLTDEVTTLLEQLVANLAGPDQPPVHSSSKRTEKKRPTLSLDDVRLLRAYTSRKLKDYSEKSEPLGTRVQFKNANPITIWDPRTNKQVEVVYPPLNDLIDYYKQRYPNQIEYHIAGKKALTNLLDVPGVTALKVIQGIIPDFERTVRDLGQQLVLKAIYKLQTLLKEVEPRQLILVGVDANGKEITRLAAQTQSMAESSNSSLGGLSGTPHSLQAGMIQPFVDAVPPIVMATRDGTGVDIVVHHP